MGKSRQRQRIEPAIFGKRLLEALRRTKKSQRDIAKLLGRNEGAVSKWVNTGAEPERLSDIIQIADYLQTSVDWLLGREATQAPPAIMDRGRIQAAIKASEGLTAALQAIDAELESME